MITNQQENLLYRETCEANYKNGNFCNMHYEKQMDYLFEKLKNNFKEKSKKVLDACCGYGRLIYYLNKFDNNQLYHGIDYSELFIKDAKEMFKNFSNISFDTGNVFNLSNEYIKKFDITINYKTLSWLPYYEECVSELIKVTKDKIYITSLFNDGDFESITKVYQNISDEKKYTYLNTYSLQKFKKFVESQGAKVIDAIPMHLDFDLNKPDNINEVQTYTELLVDNSRIEITANTILNWKLITIEC